MTADTHDRIPGYLTAMTLFGTSVVAVSVTALARGKELPDTFRASDLALGALATQKFTRLIAKDAVTTPLRAPFTEFDRPLGSAEVQERPKEGEHRHVFGELLTCPFCLAPWTATAYVAALAIAPRAARAWAAVFTIVGASDALQHVYARVRTD